ncbi:MAG: hypothetical protein HQL53_06625 [Magnetococcales bacterium]|nr:hypothetical protein [Magnetococcales bacterium]
MKCKRHRFGSHSEEKRRISDTGINPPLDGNTPPPSHVTGHYTTAGLTSGGLCAILLGLGFALGGCGSTEPPKEAAEAPLAATTLQPPPPPVGLSPAAPALMPLYSQPQRRLTSLPLPRQKISAAVYRFRAGNGSPLENSLTRVATPQLIQTLERSGWFSPVERERIDHLQAERNLSGIPSQDAVGMPPLDSARVILEGGLLSYDALNVPAAEAQHYLPGSPPGPALSHRLAIYLRAIDVASGRIVQSVTASHVLMARRVDARLHHVTAIEDAKRGEGGFTMMDPAQLALKDVLHKGVASMIAQGVLAGTWKLKDSRDLHHPMIAHYANRERSGNQPPTHAAPTLAPFDNQQLRTDQAEMAFEIFAPSFQNGAGGAHIPDSGDDSYNHQGVVIYAPAFSKEKSGGQSFQERDTNWRRR